MDKKLAARPQPWVCVPLVARSVPEFLSQASRLAAKNPDIIEVRLDYLPEIASLDVKTLLQEVAAACPHLPLLATFRSFEQGGSQPLEENSRFEIARQALASGVISLLDIEFTLSPDFQSNLLELARAQGVLSVISQHDFKTTPPLAEISNLLEKMAATGADVVKLAVMPQTPADCLNLLTASLQAQQTFLQDRLLITMAMGALGSFTRLAAPFYGSCLSFAVGEQSSAPGQIEIDTLRGLWQNWNVRNG